MSVLGLVIIRQGSPWHGIEDSRLRRANDGKGRNFYIGQGWVVGKGRIRGLPQRPASNPNPTMSEIIATLSTLSPHLNRRTLNQLTIIVEAMLAMTGRVTLLGLSRWAEKGGSYRTVQRFFKEKMDWPMLRWQLIKQHLKGAKS